MKRISGFSLTELMLATLIGSLLITASLQLLAQNRARWRAAENLASLEERAIFAFAALEQDIQLAGYWGRHSNGTWIANPDNLTVRCNGKDVTAWASAFDRPVEAENSQYSAPCRAFTGNMSGSDTLTIRHAGAQPKILQPGQLYVYSTHNGGRLFDPGRASFHPDEGGTSHSLHISNWYVDRNSTEEQLPALRRHALTKNGVMRSQEIIPGIEDMQISIGIDRNEDGAADGFVDPGMEGDAPVKALRILLTVVAPMAEPDGHRQRLRVGRTIWLRNQLY